MITPLVCFILAQAPTANDFFPVVPGTVRTYQAKGGETLVNTIGKPLDMGGVTVIPITESSGAGIGKATYYRVDADQISIVAYDVNKPLPVPLPVLKLASGKMTWDFQGKTGVGSSAERLLARGESHPAGQRTFNGRKVDVVAVLLKAAVGQGLAGYTIEQNTIYAKGIGIIEQETTIQLGKKKTKSKYELVSVTPGS